MSRVPTKPEILDWIAMHPANRSKRDIAKAFGVKGADRADLKRMLRELEDDGRLERRRRSYRDPESLPPVAVLQIAGPDADGDLFARPIDWSGEGPEPRILMLTRAADPALGAGDRVLARLVPAEPGDHDYDARLIRKIGLSPRKVVGIFRAGTEGGRILPIDKGADREWRVPPAATHGATDGELVEAEQTGPRGRLGLPTARIVERLGDPSGPRAVSLIAIHQHGIPDAFPEAVLSEAEAMAEIGSDGRTDLREMPLVTIDPADARDHDDAVYAKPDDDPANSGGHVVWVAIADVAAYVRPATALDHEARLRGNSTYFPDRVVPMLPDRLSGELCSLHEGVDRPCIACRLTIDAGGTPVGWRFERAMMRSAASLTYEQVQAARDGRPDEVTAPLSDRVIAPLYAAWEAMMRARARRQPLDLDLPERRIVLDRSGRVVSVDLKERLDAHRLIEEFMVAANVAAARELGAAKVPLLYRVHEEPTPEKLEALREVALAAGLTLAKGQVLKTAHLNRLLAAAEDTDHAEIVNLATLRAMTQAYYAPENLGHFGLALGAYAHFTSPIRRYADLMVHRALVTRNDWGSDGLTDEDVVRLPATAEAISQTERRSMAAERDTTDRYLAAYLSERVGTELSGRITGIQRFGAFVKLDGTGADGLVPVRSMGREFFHYDAASETLMGSDSGRRITLGQMVTVRLVEAVPLTGGLILELLEVDGQNLARGPRPRRSRGMARKGGAQKGGLRKARKVTRRRPTK